jgi:ATP-dependent helicase/nuclease subunit B
MPVTLSADILLAEYEGIVKQTVLTLLETKQAKLPDLSSICIFTPGSNLSRHFRQCMLENLPAQQTAVIPPYIGPLRHWINDTIALPDDGVNILSDQARQLLFVEALAEHPALFKEENKWQVSSALLHLFDELALNEADILDHSDAEWSKTLENAYNCQHSNHHLQQEATLVFTLWHAWRQQLQASHLLDATGAYVERLKQARTNLDNEQHYFLLVPNHLSHCEQQLIQAFSAHNMCTIIDYSNTVDTSNNDPRASVNAYLNAAFDFETAPLQQRANTFNQQYQKTRLPFSLFYARDAETEARAVDLQVRLWLLEGKQNIGIVSEDRKLSRRVRALLERANVYIQDMAGWSLSTTSAAAVVERWLQCIEQDFDYRPMLDLLKSHFYSSGLDNNEQLETVYRLEHDIILHENIGHGIRRYRKQLEYRLHRLQSWPANTYSNIVLLLEQLDKASRYLQRLYRSDRKINLDQYLDALTTSLEQLGILTSFGKDAAGIKLLNALENMHIGLLCSNPKMHWHDFRIWLAMTLEQQLFSPQTAPAPVTLMNLTQAQCLHFDALIIAAADKQHFPGKPDASPFFNQSVRRSLGLSDWQQQRDYKLQQFRRLLQASADILVTCKHEENGEPVPLSPWIESLVTFHCLTHTGPLQNTGLQQLLEQNTSVFICDTDKLPQVPQQPKPSLPLEALPQRISASAHQRLIDCPYKYFAGDGLSLKPPDEIREELQKSDYGERVHKILNAFHKTVKNLPDPFAEKLTEANRDKAIDHLKLISEAVFKQDTEDNALHRSWLYRWTQHIPAYIDWQIKQQQQWTVNATEKQCETTLADINLTLYGRLDRIDSHVEQDNRCAIIDYKTGATARQDDVDCGEDVQLATYALLAGEASSVMYLSLDESNGAVRTRARLEDEALLTLTRNVRTRLQSMRNMQREGKPMPAWGDDQTCSYCDFSGLCRKKVWNNES